MLVDPAVVARPGAGVVAALVRAGQNTAGMELAADLAGPVDGGGVELDLDAEPGVGGVALQRVLGVERHLPIRTAVPDRLPEGLRVGQKRLRATAGAGAGAAARGRTLNWSRIQRRRQVGLR